ncbi:geranylgeranyl reductase family protein [candidate division WOR-3 bacterium]|nr:geranylgeranyl reductase family protein [candidate division WOR-3 bacterium]
MNIKDVIICGAGPAGSSLAYFLSREGFDVLLLDKAKFPRAKPCAGAFQISLGDFFPFSLEDVAEDKISGFSFRKNRNSCDVLLDVPISYVVDRKKFDDFLLRKAIESGVEFIEECKVLKVEEGIVYSASNKFRGKIVVGAEGVSSVVRRFGRYRKFKNMIKTICADIPISFEKKFVFDFSYTEGGYAWIFPKGDKTNVGFGTLPGDFKDGEIILSKILEDYEFPEPLNVYKWTYPLFTSPELLVWRNTLLIGDAASLVNPASGGGIYNAVQSANLASKAINLCLREGKTLKIYQDLVKKHIYPMFYYSKIFNLILENVPSPILFLRLIKPFLAYLAKNLS